MAGLASRQHPPDSLSDAEPFWKGLNRNYRITSLRHPKSKVQASHARHRCRPFWLLLLKDRRCKYQHAARSASGRGLVCRFAIRHRVVDIIHRSDVSPAAVSSAKVIVKVSVFTVALLRFLQPRLH